MPEYSASKLPCLEVRVRHLKCHAYAKSSVGEIRVARQVRSIEVNSADWMLVKKACVAQCENGVQYGPGKNH